MTTIFAAPAFHQPRCGIDLRTYLLFSSRTSPHLNFESNLYRTSASASSTMYFGVRLQNTQSVARDHLANERTFLAWLRTGLTFASVGVALTQLFRLVESNDKFMHSASTVLGSMFVSCGMLVLVVGTSRYFHVQSVLQTGMFPATRSSIWLSFVVSLSLVVVTLAFILKASIGTK